jgi:hypothetical protein
MPILYKNNPMPLDGALFVTNPRRRRKNLMMRENNAKDRFIRKELGMPLQRIKRIKSQDFAQYTELFEKAGGDDGFEGRKKTKKIRDNKFFASLEQGDTRRKRRGKAAPKKKSTAKRAKGSKSSGSQSKTQLGITLKRLGYRGKISRMSVDSRIKKIKELRAKGKTEKAFEGVSRSKKNPRRRNPLAKGSQASRIYRQLAAKVIKGEKLSARDRKRFQDLAYANTQKELTYTTIAASAKRKRAASRGTGSKAQASKVSAAGPIPQKLLPVIASKPADAAGKAVAKSVRGVGARKVKGSCKLMNAWKAFLQYKKARKQLTGRTLTNYQYYYKFLPEMINFCVKAGNITKAEGAKLLAEKRKQYNANKKSKKVSTPTRRKSVAKRSKSSKRVSKKITSLARAVNRGEIKASIKNKVKKGSMLKWGEFQQAFTGCGHTKKALGRMYSAYKKAHGAVPKKRKPSKSSVSKRRKSAAKRAKGSKSLSKITLEDIKKVLKRRSPKGSKTLKDGRLANLKADQKKIIAYANRLRRKGDSKSAAISKAITYYRSAIHGKSGKVVKRKAATLRSRKKGLAQRYNPRRRRRNSVKSAVASIRPLDLLESVNQWAAGLIGNLAGQKQGKKVAAIANTSLVLGELAGVHYLFSKVPQIDEFASNVADTLSSYLKKIPIVDKAAGAPQWLVQNGYYSIQGIAALALIGVAERLNLVSAGSTVEWGGLAISSGVMLDVAAKLFGSSSDLQGVHLNGYGDGGQYMITAPQTIQMQRRLNPGYGAVKMNPGYGSLSLNGAEGSMGPQGAQGAQGYGAVLFSGSGY